MRKLFTVYILILLLVTPTLFADDYKDYNYARKQVKYLEFQIHKKTKNIVLTAYTKTDTTSLSFVKSDMKFTDDLIQINENSFINQNELTIDQVSFPLDLISDSRVYETENKVVITLLKRGTSQPKLYNFKKGNLIEPFDDIEISDEKFIRGLILTYKGNIIISGEVNKDVISIFGNIKVNSSATVRGDIVAFNGKVSSSKNAIIYGDIYDSSNKRNRRRLYGRNGNDFIIDAKINYNRVDGLLLGLTAEFNDYDSLRPHLKAEVGYALASERARLKFSIEQTLLTAPSWSLGGTIFQDLLSNDDWIIEDDENSLFALMFTEDYKDYYEAAGGTIYSKVRPFKDISFEAGYTYYETNWLRAHRNLWSLIGGDKQFDRNFHSVEPLYRNSSLTEIDTTSNGYLYFKLNYNNHKDSPYSSASYWNISTELEWSDPGLNSDYNYRRYQLSIKRHQYINEYLSLRVKGFIGSSDGYLPIYKRYYLGGLGTIHGYQNKEFIGSRFWMVNNEYRIKFPKSDFYFSILWDIGQIANDQKLDNEIEIKQSLGLSFSFEDDIKLILSKRLDRSYNDYPKFYARFSFFF